nr:hypothetical protein [Tanacetum cinerariifolium]
SQKELNTTLTKVTEQMTQLTSMCELACQIVQKNLEEKQLEEEQAIKAQSWKLLVCYDDDDDEESLNSLEDNIISELPSYSAVTPTEPVDSLSMGDEHLNTILATKSDEFIKPASFNVESDLIESMPNHDSSVIISSKIDSFFDKFARELTLLKSFPPRIDETDCHPEKEIRLTKDILILEELLDNYSLSLPATESYHFDIPSPYRPPAKPPDGITGTLNIKMMGDVSDQKYSRKPEDSRQRILYSSLHFLCLTWESLSAGCQKPGHLAARLGGAEMKVATWDDLAFKLITLSIPGNLKTLAKGFYPPSLNFLSFN